MNDEFNDENIITALDVHANAAWIQSSVSVGVSDVFLYKVKLIFLISDPENIFLLIV